MLQEGHDGGLCASTLFSTHTHTLSLSNAVDVEKDLLDTYTIRETYNSIYEDTAAKKK